jgi:hypothetical protein
VKVQVERVLIPAGSTVGIVFGRPVNDFTKVIAGGADYREAAALGELISQSDEPVVVEMPDWAVLGILELPEG